MWTITPTPSSRSRVTSVFHPRGHGRGVRFCKLGRHIVNGALILSSFCHCRRGIAANSVVFTLCETYVLIVALL